MRSLNKYGNSSIEDKIVLPSESAHHRFGNGVIKIEAKVILHHWKKRRV